MSQQQQILSLWLALERIPRLATSKKLAIVKQFGLSELFQMSATSLHKMGLSSSQIQAITQPNWGVIDNCFTQCQQKGIEVIHIEQSQYPQLLLHTHNPPLILFLQGNVALLNQPQLAIVGSRSATMSALEQTKRFASSLARSKLVITSGLAIGIDSAAHQGALQVNGSTIAVVATGLDRVYPKRNTALAKQIVEQDGLIVSEYLPGSVAHKGCFPRRNRIITGMSLGTLVMEATIKSGSLISAKLALEQNRDVFAMPGSIHNPQSKGCHYLIKQGAILVDEVDDILSVLEIPVSDGLICSDAKKSQKSDQQDLFIDPLLSSVDYEATPVDRVVSRSKLPTEEVITRLITLELNGLVAAVPGGYIRLN